MSKPRRPISARRSGERNSSRAARHSSGESHRKPFQPCRTTSSYDGIRPATNGFPAAMSWITRLFDFAVETGGGRVGTTPTWLWATTRRTAPGLQRTSASAWFETVTRRKSVSSASRRSSRSGSSVSQLPRWPIQTSRIGPGSSGPPSIASRSAQNSAGSGIATTRSTPRSA